MENSRWAPESIGLQCKSHRNFILQILWPKSTAFLGMGEEFCEPTAPARVLTIHAILHLSLLMGCFRQRAKAANSWRPSYAVTT